MRPDNIPVLNAESVLNLRSPSEIQIQHQGKSFPNRYQMYLFSNRVSPKKRNCNCSGIRIILYYIVPERRPKKTKLSNLKAKQLNHGIL
jgi:hypothetical protein